MTAQNVAELIRREFIGSPSMNFFSGVDVSDKIAGTNGKVHIVVGIRSEQPCYRTAAIASGKLEFVEQLGDQVLVHFLSDDGLAFVAKPEQKPALRCCVSVPDPKIFIDLILTADFV